MLSAVEQLRAEDRALSIEALHDRGVSQAALARTVVIDFGSAASAFELLAPRGYRIDGTFKDILELEPDFN